MMCDGLIDCQDLSDECNKYCNKTMVDNVVVEIMGWVIGILAVLFKFNGTSIPKTIKSVIVSKNYDAFINEMLLSIVSFGDVLLGILY